MTQGGFPRPGELIGPYRVGERLGQGGMGIVHEALDTQLDRRVALKIISPHLAHDPEFRARFTREAQAQASLDSPHVVHVYAHGEVDGRLYIATQLVPDGDLGQMIRRSGAPPLRLALDVIEQVASGLADAHAAGLVHRDIKPANVLLRIAGGSVRAYLADFGIARQVSGQTQLTRTGSTVGTPTYMAPELHTGGRPGPATDVYSLGCLLWAALSGDAPYRGTTDYQVVNLHLTAPIPQVPETSPMAAAANRVLRTAMAKQPGDRYPHAGAMRDDLRAALQVPDGSGSAVPPPPPAGPSGAPRTGLVVALVAVIVLGLAGLGVAYAVTRDGGDRPSADPSAPATAGSAETDAPPSGSPTEPSTESPTDAPPTTEETTEEPTGTDDPPRDGDARKAVEVLTGALRGQEGVDPGTAGCVAESLVDKLGVARMVEAGMLTPELEVNDDPMSGGLPADIQGAVVGAAFDCALSNIAP